MPTAAYHFYDTGWFQDLVIIAIFVFAAIVITFREWRRRPRSTITGWWHYQHPDDGKRNWTPAAWDNACSGSLARSIERRTRERSR